jgi:hypothetical protein
VCPTTAQEIQDADLDNNFDKYVDFTQVQKPQVDVVTRGGTEVRYRLDLYNHYAFMQEMFEAQNSEAIKMNFSPSGCTSSTQSAVGVLLEINGVRAHNGEDLVSVHAQRITMTIHQTVRSERFSHASSTSVIGHFFNDPIGQAYRRFLYLPVVAKIFLYDKRIPDSLAVYRQMM